MQDRRWSGALVVGQTHSYGRQTRILRIKPTTNDGRPTTKRNTPQFHRETGAREYNTI
jgi:hypothetical protein